jgi:hypothetical protein
MGQKIQTLLLCWKELHCCKVYFFCLFFVVLYSTSFRLAENDKLNKKQAAKPKEKRTKEIPRPEKITKLQHDMGLADDRRRYSHCRVGCFILFCFQPNT